MILRLKPRLIQLLILRLFPYESCYGVLRLQVRRHFAISVAPYSRGLCRDQIVSRIECPQFWWLSRCLSARLLAIERRRLINLDFVYRLCLILTLIIVLLNDTFTSSENGYTWWHRWPMSCVSFAHSLKRAPSHAVRVATRWATAKFPRNLRRTHGSGVTRTVHISYYFPPPPLLAFPPLYPVVLLPCVFRIRYISGLAR